MIKIKSVKKLVVSIIICQLAAFVGTLFTISSVKTWYVTINKPGFTPPNWIFGPAWTILYLLMGISLYIVWVEGFEKSKNAIKIFGIQLALNVLWSILFFGLKSPLYAFIEILILWATIVLTILNFYRISKPAAYILVPYLLWVSFAAVLNFSVYLLN